MCPILNEALLNSNTIRIHLMFLFFSQLQYLITSDDFKPNCSLVVLDFMIRKGIITPDSGKSSFFSDWFHFLHKRRIYEVRGRLISVELIRNRKIIYWFYLYDIVEGSKSSWFIMFTFRLIPKRNAWTLFSRTPRDWLNLSFYKDNFGIK